MNQRQGVFAAVEAVVGTIEGSKVELSERQKKEVYALLFSMFKSGDIEYRGGCPDDAKLLKYIPGLVNNWLRKDPGLNGNVKYEAKNPGSRSGAGDEQLKAMKALAAVTSDPEALAEIEAAIEQRKAELAKAKQQPIDINNLPEHLRRFVKVG